MQLVNGCRLFLILFLFLIGCVSTLKNSTSLSTEAKASQVCINLRFFNEVKPTNRKDYVKIRFYANDENRYKEILRHWNIDSDCKTSSRALDVVYNLKKVEPSWHIWWQFTSLLSAHLIPYWTDYSVEVQLYDPFGSKIIDQTQVDIHTEYSAYKILTSVSQQSELKRSIGIRDAKDAFLIEKTAQLIIQSEL